MINLRKMQRKSLSLTLFCALVAILLPVAESTAAPKKKRVLYLGDSMSMGAFGTTLDQEIRNAGFEVYTYVAGGATPYYWLSRYSTIKGSIGYWEKTPRGERRINVTKGVPKVEALMDKIDPDVVIVQTGTNLYSALRSKRRTKGENVREVEGLLNHMIEAATQGGRQCYWITPPTAHTERYPKELQKELNDLTTRVVGRQARIYDSGKVTTYTDPYPENDGIHYGQTEARQWAALVAKDFNKFMGSSRAGTFPSGGILASNASQKKEIPRARPVRFLAKGLRSKDKPPTKNREPEKTKVAIADKPPVKKRPPVLIVKRAIPVETKGIQWAGVELEVKLVEKSELKSLRSVDYSYCFAMNEYEVLRVNSGYYPHKRIRIARVVMWNKKVNQRVLDEAVGSSPRGGWKLVPMSNYPRFEKMQIVDDLSLAPELPVYMISFE